MNFMKLLKAAAVCCFLTALAAQASEKKPMNVLFLAIDDLNTWLLSETHRYGGKVSVPNIQKLADEGVPVSYTHLRAHETSLQLVWRLLLEK